MRPLIHYLLLPSLLVMLGACRRTPSRSAVVDALRAANPAIDTVTVIERVWADGPPWFSCAEVIAKARSAVDSAVVRDQVGNWRALVLSDWMSLRDTLAGEVVDPGWCTAVLRDEPARLRGGWRPIRGDTIPSGGRRRGWDVPAGRPKISVVDAPRRVGTDSAVAEYLVTLAANANGVALGGERDTTRYRALLLRDGRRWRVLNARWRAP